MPTSAKENLLPAQWSREGKNGKLGSLPALPVVYRGQWPNQSTRRNRPLSSQSLSRPALDFRDGSSLTPDFEIAGRPFYF